MDWQYYIDELSNDQLAVISLPIFIVAILIEVYLARQTQRKLYHSKDTLVSLSMLLITIFVEFIPKQIACSYL